MEKTYCDFIDEITEDELYEGLLAYGFFTDKLPPVFSAESFYSYCKSNNTLFNSKWHEHISFTTMRNISIPRTMGIPVPMKYANLCFHLKNNWKNIQSHFHSTTGCNNYRVSRIHLRKMKNSKALFEMNYKDWHVDGNPETDLLIQEEIASKYLVKADISTCFPSIYSHSIPWALIGKTESKVTCKDKSKWYNKIDNACSEMKNGETHGLLIGPHSSNLLSEIVLTVVDNELYAKRYRFYRNIDDYDCYVDSYEKAQLFLKDLEATLNEYDLPLNHKKTRILELPVATTEHWIHKLNGVPILTNYGKVSYQTVNKYLDTALILSETEENAAVLKYAIKTLSQYKFTRNAEVQAVKRIMHLAILNPYLLSIIDTYVFKVYSVDKNQIQSFANAVMEEAKKINNYEGISYSIFFALEYGFSLKDDFKDWIFERYNCISLILSWLYYLRACRGNKRATIMKSFKKKAVELRDNNMDRYWLFCYEALSEKELEDEWALLKKNGISFIKDKYFTKPN